GEHGWQWLGEDYFTAIQSIGIPMWYAWTMIFKGEDPEFHHTFIFTLRYGSYGDEVIALQRTLTLEGMFTGKIDGKFGLITLASIKVFQKRHNLKADGIVGP